MKEGVILLGSLLYTKEGRESLERTKGELAVPDPKPEKALGVLLELEEEGRDESEVD